MMDPWEDYFFREHGEEELRGWAKRLKLFRYIRAAGGHANDGDSLEVVFLYKSDGDISKFFKSLGVELVTHDTKPPQPEVGVPYSGDVFSSFPSLIKGTTWIEQPGHCQIGGIPLFAWCGHGEIRLSLQGESCDVTERHVLNAEALEKMLLNVPLKVLDPPKDNDHCLCPKYYPDYFA